MPRNANTTINARKQALLDFLPSEHSGSQGCMPDELKAWVARQEPAVSYKTIERDLKELLAQQSVIQIIDGKRYRWLRAASVRSSQPMRRDEAFLHELARRRLAHLLPSSLFSTLQQSLDEAKKVLDRPDLQRERSWFRKVITVPNLLPPPDIETTLMQTIVSAMLNEHWLDACYKKRDQYVQDAVRLMPLGIAELGGIYYLIVRYDGFDNERHLRIDRFISAIESDEPFVYPRDFTLQAYIDQGKFGYYSDEVIHLRLRISDVASQHLIDQPLSDDMTLSDAHEGWRELSATVRDDDRLLWWVLSMGVNVVVLKPTSLRQEILDTLSNISINYAQHLA